MDGIQALWNGQSNWQGTFCECALKWAVPLPESTALVLKNCSTFRICSAPRKLIVCNPSAMRSTPTRLLIRAKCLLELKLPHCSNEGCIRSKKPGSFRANDHI